MSLSADMRLSTKMWPKLVDHYIFNDLRFEFNDEIAQIDHLILYPYGFILIESKSITGEVKVNNNQEWMRSYRHQWSGMRSPIKQLELQENLLRELLYENKENILPKFLFRTIQQGFGGRCWDHICAVSSNAIVHRDEMPQEISDQLVKSEFVVDKLTKLMKLPTSKLKTVLIGGDSRPAFSSEDMNKIADFLMQQHKPSVSEQTQQINSEPVEVNPAPTLHAEISSDRVETNKSEYIVTKEETPPPETAINFPKLTCKRCGNTEQLQAKWGKFGYYVKCPNCGTNTAMKSNCPSCNSTNTKVNKTKAYYHLNCQDCNAHHEVFVQG